MDELKLAFDTVIVGVFAFAPAVLLLHVVTSLYLFVTRSRGIDLIDHVVQTIAAMGTKREGVAQFAPGLVVLALAYILGAAVFNLADRYFDNSWVGLWETDDQIKVSTYMKTYAQGRPDAGGAVLATTAATDPLDPEYFPRYLAPHLHLFARRVAQHQEAARAGDFVNDESTPEGRQLRSAVLAIYNYQKYFNYTHAETGHNILRELYHQIVVLRGVAFDSLLVFVLACLAVPLDTFRPLSGRMPATLELRRRLKRYMPIMALSFAMWLLGSMGWNHLEREYDQTTIGVFHGQVGAPTADELNEAAARTAASAVTSEQPTDGSTNDR